MVTTNKGGKSAAAKEHSGTPARSDTVHSPVPTHSQTINQENTKEIQTDNARLAPAQKQIENPNQQTKEPPTDNSLSQLTTGIAVVIIMAMLVILVSQQIKLKKMATDQAMREKMIASYSEVVDSLHNYLVDKKIMSLQTTNIHDSYFKVNLPLIKNKIIELVDKYMNEDARNTEIAADKEAILTKLKETLLENKTLTDKLTQYENGNHLLPVVHNVPYISPEYTAHIKTQIMMSAGPRKETGNTDTELGEDVAGTLSLPKQTFFWLMDGTSDSVKLSEDGKDYEESHIFSSRLLAQSIGQYVQKHIAQCFYEKITVDQLLMQARDHVQQEWTERINALPAEKKQAIMQLIQDGYKPLCSTTAIIGRLTENGHLHVLRAGDSKVFPFIHHNGEGTILQPGFKFSKDATNDNDRIAFRLDYNPENNSFHISCNKPAWAIETAENITQAFVFTDGIGRVIETQLNSNNPGITEIIKQNIARIPQKTYDDKTLIVLERI